MPKIKFILSIFSTLVLYATSFAQVQIAPVAVYMDEANKTGRIVVRNSSDAAVEIHLTLHFGYPETNEEGEIYLKVLEEVPASEPSAAEWVRIYPRQLILPPGVQQTIRLAARPPQNLPDGEYWVRPAIVTKPIEAESKRVSSDITTQINTIKRTFLSLNYRKGEVRTGVKIANLHTQISDGLLEVEINLERQGNAAFLGHMDIQIYNDNGKLVKRNKKEIAVYHSLNPVEKFSIKNLPKGKYSVKVILDTSTRVEMNRNIIKASRESEETVFEVS